MKYLVTGAAGFIGSATIRKLNSLGYEVVGIDNINDYYDVELKYARLSLALLLNSEIKTYLRHCA